MVDIDQENTSLLGNNDQREDFAIDISELEPVAECCIYKVPKRFRDTNDKAYTPQVISIGPLHHGDKNLALMEKQKRRYYKKFVERTSNKKLEEFSSFIKEHVKRICRCYDVELIDFNDEAEFIKMIQDDAVFIIELFLRNWEKKHDFLFCRGWLSLELRLDLVLLENQLPFFVLRQLYNLAFANSDNPSFLSLACEYFGVNEDETFNRNGIKHFTDLLRNDAVKTRPPNTVETKKDTDETTGNKYCATMLHEAGVKFEVVKNDCLLNVKFENGVLKIPFIWVDYVTETWYRNLIAFEQCHYSGEAYFCGYIHLLDLLVDIDKDVDLLKKKRIIANELGSNAAVTGMINNLMVGVAQFSECYGKIEEDLSRHYENPWNHTKATLKQVYFNNLWRGTATVAAFFVVLFTLGQTILAILDRAMPTK